MLMMNGFYISKCIYLLFFLSSFLENDQQDVLRWWFCAEIQRMILIWFVRGPISLCLHFYFHGDGVYDWFNIKLFYLSLFIHNCSQFFIQFTVSVSLFCLSFFSALLMLTFFVIVFFSSWMTDYVCYWNGFFIVNWIARLSLFSGSIRFVFFALFLSFIHDILSVLSNSHPLPHRWVDVSSIRWVNSSKFIDTL